MDTTNSNMQYQQAAPQVAQTVYGGQILQQSQAYPQYQQVASVPVQANPSVYAAPVKQPKGWGKLWAAFGLILLVQIIQVLFVFLGMLSRTDDGMMTVAEIGGGIAALLFVLLLGGKKLATPSLEGMGEAWKVLKWIFIADLIIAGIEAASLIADSSFELAQLWPLRLITLFLMCAGIGLFEEATFRGLCFHGLLARMGTSSKGIFWAVMISSFIFGLMHVDFVGINWTDPSQVAQAGLKVIQAGAFGFAAAVAVLKTGNLWPVIILHGLNDFMLLIVANGLMDNPVTTQYVSEGSDGLMIIGIYLLLILAYSPSVVVAIRTIKEHPTPDRGQFYRPRNYPAGYTAVAPAAATMPQQVYAVPQQNAVAPQYVATSQGYTVPQQAAPTQAYAVPQGYVAPQQTSAPQAQPSNTPPQAPGQ